MKESCPTCDSRTGLREIIYGEPVEPLDESKYAYGGCNISPFQPTWACVDCGWRGWALNDIDGTKLSDIRCPICETQGKVMLFALDDEANQKLRSNTYKIEINFENYAPNAMCMTCGWTCLLRRTYSY